MIQIIAVFTAMIIGLALGLFIAGARRRIDGVDGHVRIGNVWHEVDEHGRVIFRAEDAK